MKQVFLYALFAVLFLTAGSRLEIARREMNQPRLSPVAASLYVDSQPLGVIEVEMPIHAAAPGLIPNAEAQIVKSKKSSR